MEASVQEVGQEAITPPDFNTIVVELTYPGYDTMRFFIRRSMGSELRSLQREFMGKNETEQLLGQHQYRVDFLAKLFRQNPENVPSYPQGDDIEGNVRQYFSSDDMDDLVDHLWTAYQSKLYPKELLSSISR